MVFDGFQEIHLFSYPALYVAEIGKSDMRTSLRRVKAGYNNSQSFSTLLFRSNFKGVNLPRFPFTATTTPTVLRSNGYRLWSRGEVRGDSEGLLAM